MTRPSDVSSGTDQSLDILIVDDNTTYLAVLEDMLQLHEPRLKLRTATNGHEALEHFSQRAPSLIITDLEMPEMNGVTLIETITATARNGTPPIIVVTAYGSAAVCQQLAKLGVRQILHKPVRLEALIAAIGEELSLPR